MQPSTLAKRGNILLFIAIAAFYLYGLGHMPLVGPDEPRYAEVAREMFLRRDLMTPTLGGHSWFEKPALLYWLMIASFKMFGVSEWSARLPAALSGLLTIVAVYWIAQRVERRDPAIRNLGFHSGLVAATSVGMVVFSRAASFDIVLTMTLTWALAFYVAYELEENEKSRGLLAGFYTFVGLALLAKGLIGILIPAGVIALYYVFGRRLPKRRTAMSLPWGIPLVLIVAATWYAPVALLHGWPFIDQFFIQHHFARYITPKYHHTAPIFYYFLAIPLIGLPWTVFMLVGFIQTARSPWRKTDMQKDPISRLRMFTFAWVCFPLVFFSFSSSKLPGYTCVLNPG